MRVFSFLPPSVLSFPFLSFPFLPFLASSFPCSQTPKTRKQNKTKQDKTRQINVLLLFTFSCLFVAVLLFSYGAPFLHYSTPKGSSYWRRLKLRHISAGKLCFLKSFLHIVPTWSTTASQQKTCHKGAYEDSFTNTQKGRFKDCTNACGDILQANLHAFAFCRYDLS